MIIYKSNFILLAKKIVNFVHLKHGNKLFFRVIIIFKVKIPFLEIFILSYENVLC